MRKILMAVIAMLTTAGMMAQTPFVYKGERLTTSEHNILVKPGKSKPRQHVYATMQEALRWAETLTTQGDTLWKTIYVEPGVYWLDNPDDPDVRTPLKGENTPFAMKLRLNHVAIRGMGRGPEEVVMAVNRGQTQGAEGNYTMLHITGSHFAASGVTFGNYCNVDLDYALNPKLSRPRRGKAIVQAQLAICQGRWYEFDNCRFISRLNLCPFVGAEETRFTNCYFECTDDALHGTALYDRCRLTLYSGKPFYTARGARFVDCDIHSKVRGTQYLTKVSGPISLQRCRWTSDDPGLEIKWNRHPNPDHACLMEECTLNGQPLSLPQPTEPLPVAIPAVPMQRQTTVAPGLWTIDCHKPLDTEHYDWQPDSLRPSWGYAQGVDGAEGQWGMVQLQRGARLMFTPRASDRPTRALLSLSPCKGPGQGFGSATGQYMDVCIRFDTRTLTGYGLRLERTPDYDKAVVASLVRYDKGHVEALTTPVRCTLFRPDCRVEVWTKDDSVWASVSRDGEEPLTLHAAMPVAPTAYGFHLQHTGSVGASATLVRGLELK